MKTTELRIGNWVFGNKLRIGNWVFGNKVAIQVKSSIDLCNIENLPDEFEPIPLNYKWLRKFGFDDSEYKDGYIGVDVNNSNFVLSKPEKYEFTKNYIWEYKAGVWQKFVELKYVHQLQNLFFAITGKELTIKDNKQ